MEVNTVAMNSLVRLYLSIAILPEAVIAGLIALKSREVLSLTQDQRVSGRKDQRVSGRKFAHDHE
jgi:hypothetical protein